MKRLLAIAISLITLLSTFSICVSHEAKAEPATDVMAQYASFVSASNNYKKIFGQDVAIGQTVERVLSGIINDPPPHYQWHSWGGRTYPNMDGFSIRVETIQQDYVYKIIGIGQMTGSQPSASGWVQVNSPFRIEQINYAVNSTFPSEWGTNYVRIYVDVETGRIDFSAKWYNWPALIDAPAFRFAITIAKLGGTLPPFSYETSRVRASYAYDTNTNRVVMFGGTTWNSSDCRSDFWTFDPVTYQWTSVSAGSEPSKRWDAAMSYNTVANSFLVFGGGDVSGAIGDTWKFQFTGSGTGTWTHITDTGPSARGNAKMVYDSKNDLIVLFGGEESVYSHGDTWVFDPSTNVWSNKNPSPSPQERARAAMAYDAESGKVLLFGGLNKAAGSLLNDTWLYDVATNTWQQVVTATAPSAREFPSLASDGNGVFYLFGGWRMDADGLSLYLDDTWKFDLTTMEWTKASPSTSPPAQSQGALLHIGSSRFILVGGWRDSPLGEVWIYDANQNTWSTEVGPPPPQYQLTVTSSPIIGITFTINGTQETTPCTEWLVEGYYTLEMPQTHNGYVWSHWLEDGDPNRIKTILLQGTTWTAVYEPAPHPPVGGKATPISMPTIKPKLQTPWIWLTTVILSMVITVVFVKLKKKK